MSFYKTKQPGHPYTPFSSHKVHVHNAATLLVAIHMHAVHMGKGVSSWVHKLGYFVSSSSMPCGRASWPSEHSCNIYHATYVGSGSRYSVTLSHTMLDLAEDPRPPIPLYFLCAPRLLPSSLLQPLLLPSSMMPGKDAASGVRRRGNEPDAHTWLFAKDLSHCEDLV